MEASTKEDNVSILKLQTIKTVFEGLSSEEQANLLIDLMNSAKIDSIIRPTRLDTCSDLELIKRLGRCESYAFIDYNREKFDDWLYLCLAKAMTVVKKDYLDQCFHLYKLLESKSIGYSYIRDNIEITGLPTDKCSHHFGISIDNHENDIEKQNLFQHDFLDRTVDKLQICLYINYRQFVMKIRFIDLCLNMVSRDDGVLLILFMLQYLDPIVDVEKYSKAKDEFYRILNIKYFSEKREEAEVFFINQKRVEALEKKEEIYRILTSISSWSEQELFQDVLVFSCLKIIVSHYEGFHLYYDLMEVI